MVLNRIRSSATMNCNAQIRKYRQQKNLKLFRFQSRQTPLFYFLSISHIHVMQKNPRIYTQHQLPTTISHLESLIAIPLEQETSNVSKIVHTLLSPASGQQKLSQWPSVSKYPGLCRAPQRIAQAQLTPSPAAVTAADRTWEQNRYIK